MWELKTSFILLLSLSSFPLLVTSDHECTQSSQLRVQANCEKKSMNLYDTFSNWRRESYQIKNKDQIQSFQNELKNHESCYDEFKSCSSLNGTAQKRMTDFKLRFEHWQNRVDFYVKKFTSCIPKVMQLFDSEHCFSYFHENWNKKTPTQRCTFFEQYEKCVKDWVDKQCGGNMKNVVSEHISMEKKLDGCK